MATTCLFCKIIAGEATSTPVYQDELVYAFRDIHPVAPVHVLIVPRQHIASVNELADTDAALIGKMVLVARQLAAQEGLARDGYRLVLNTGPHGGQTIHHIHLHLIGGRPLRAGMG
jgi:histidine triad (HIT) family protein